MQLLRDLTALEGYVFDVKAIKLIRKLKRDIVNRDKAWDAFIDAREGKE